MPNLRPISRTPNLQMEAFVLFQLAAFFLHTTELSSVTTLNSSVPYKLLGLCSRKLKILPLGDSITSGGG